MTTRSVAPAVAVAALAAVVGLSGCGWRGLNSITLPGTKGGGPGSYVIQAQMPEVNNIQQNARVRVGDVNVGTVTKIERQGWHALVTMRIDGDVALPANATATVGQTSLLGSLHIELVEPQDVPEEGKLLQGSVIPLSNSGAFPSTEQTLAAVSLLLNTGGIGQVQEIVQNLAVGFHGREEDLRSLVGQLDTFVANLDDQSAEIVAATESLDRLATRFADRKSVLDRALTTIPEALKVVSDQRHTLTEAIDKLGRFSELAADTTNQTKADLVRELKDIAPVIKSLADSGPALTRSMSALLTYPFPNETLENWMRGDYGNLTAVIDLTLSRLDAAFLTGTRFEGDLTAIEMAWGRTIGQLPSPYSAGNPLVVPYHVDQGP